MSAAWYNIKYSHINVQKKSKLENILYVVIHSRVYILEMLKVQKQKLRTMPKLELKKTLR